MDPWRVKLVAVSAAVGRGRRGAAESGVREGRSKSGGAKMQQQQAARPCTHARSQPVCAPIPCIVGVRATWQRWQYFRRPQKIRRQSGQLVLAWRSVSCLRRRIELYVWAQAERCVASLCCKQNSQTSQKALWKAAEKTAHLAALRTLCVACAFWM